MCRAERAHQAYTFDDGHCASGHREHPGEVERHREQRFLRYVHDVAGRDILRITGILDNGLPHTVLERVQDDVCVSPID